MTELEQKEELVTEKESVLTSKDLKKAFATYWLTTELSNSYERLQALMFCNAMSGSLKKLYKDDEQGYKDALVRHLMFYNSEGSMGAAILGITLSMEEERSQGVDIPDEAITGIKTGLMGPLAGIGDTLVWGSLKPIIIALACSLALAGNPLGAFIPFLFPLLIVTLGYNAMKYSYKLGKESILRLMQSGMINKIIIGASTLGLFMMGALSSTYVKIATPLSLDLKNTDPIVLQDILDSILPGILPLMAIFGIYFYFKKKGFNYNNVLFFVILISLVSAFLGILG